MTRRVLVCIQDTGVAHVVVSRLQKDGIDVVVVDGPGKLVEAAGGEVDALVVQDRYPSGEAGSSLLRQVRVARGGAVPAVYLLTQELAAADRHVLEKQYKVGAFLKFEATPHSIAKALLEAAGGEEPDIVLHEDEMHASFDIEVATHSQLEEEPLDLLDDLDSFGEDAATLEVAKADLSAVKAELDSRFPTVGGESVSGSDEDEVTRESSATELMAVEQLRALVDPPAGDVTSEGDEEEAAEDRSTHEVPLALDGMTLDGMFDQPSELPAPGGEDDFEFPRTEATPRIGGPPAADPPEPEPIEAAEVPLPAPPVDDEADEIDEALAAAAESSADLDEVSDMQTNGIHDESSGEAPRGDEMEINDLKKALLAQKKGKEAAEKRVKELETRLTKLDPQPLGSGEGGVPAEGVFEDLRYPKLLALCRAEGFSGAVKLQIGGTNTRTVFLRDGLPIGYASSEPGERIGRMMVEQGRITDEQYIKAATVMVERGIKLTEALVELGFIEGETLAVEMRNLTRDQIIHGFELTQGRFTTQAGQAPDQSTSTFDFGPGEIYVQGYRQYAPKQEMQALFESLRDRYLVTGDRLQAFRPKLGLNTDDERLLRLLGEAYTLEEAVDRAEVTPDHAARLVSALQALDLVEEWSPGVEQFRARLRTERQLHAEQIAALREEMSQREQRLFEGFEKALSKISAATGGSGVKLSDHVEKPAKSSGTPFASLSSSSSPSSNAGSASAASASGPSSSGPSSSGPSSSGPSSSAPSSSSPSSSSPSSSSPSSGSAGASLSSGGSSSAGSPASSASSALGSASSLLGSPPVEATVKAEAPKPPAPASNGAPSSTGVSMVTTMPPPKADAKEPPAPKNSFGTPPKGDSPADKKYREGLEQAAGDRLDEAEVTLREAVRMDASRPEYLLSLARVLLANPRYERAGTLPVVRSLLDRAVQIAPDNGDVKELHQQVVSEMGG